MTTERLTTELGDILRAGEIIRDGGLVAFPTETVYGLGANALDAEAVRSVYRAKGRPSDNPMIVHIADLRGLYPLVRGGKDGVRGSAEGGRQDMAGTSYDDIPEVGPGAVCHNRRA